MNGASSVPGFRSLSQAGIQLEKGLSGTPVPDSAVDQVRAASEDPNWPPLPTLAKSEQSTAEKTRKAPSVNVQPREPGTKRPLPRDRDPRTGGPHLPAVPSGDVKPGHYVGKLPMVQFTCPCCAVLLTIPSPDTYNGEPGPCPKCSALVLPPRQVSPFALAAASSEQADETAKLRHFSGHTL